MNLRLGVYRIWLCASILMGVSIRLLAQDSVHQMYNKGGMELNGIRTLTYEYRRGFYRNAHGCPAFGVFTFMKSTAEESNYRIGKGSSFKVGNSYYRVLKIYRSNPRKGEKGHLDFIKLSEKPKHGYISNDHPRGK